jgi:hypothetical protein
MGRHDCSEAREVVVIARKERERMSFEFLAMTPLGGGAAKMATRRHSIEVAGGALMGRWFWA